MIRLIHSTLIEELESVRLFGEQYCRINYWCLGNNGPEQPYIFDAITGITDGENIHVNE
jgi:hypothetical protein